MKLTDLGRLIEERIKKSKEKGLDVFKREIDIIEEEIDGFTFEFDVRNSIVDINNGLDRQEVISDAIKLVGTSDADMNDFDAEYEKAERIIAVVEEAFKEV